MQPRLHFVDDGAHAFIARPRSDILLQGFIWMRKNVSSDRETGEQRKEENPAAETFEDLAAIHIFRLGVLRGGTLVTKMTADVGNDHLLCFRIEI